MTSISLLALLVVLGGLRLQLTNAAPGFADRRQKLDLRDGDGGENSNSDKQQILDRLQQDGIVAFTYKGMLVLVTEDDSNGNKRTQNGDTLSLDTRDPGATAYSNYIIMRPPESTFEKIVDLLNTSS